MHSQFPGYSDAMMRVLGHIAQGQPLSEHEAPCEALAKYFANARSLTTIRMVLP